MTQKVLILLKDLHAEKDLIASAASFLSQWSKDITSGGFSWQFEIQRADFNFPVISGVGIQGYSNSQVPIKYLDPRAVLFAATGKQCDVVALIYSSLTYPNTISVHSPFIENGVTCTQLPISSQANKEGITENLAHELLHACYFLANQKGANLIDDVHQHSGLTDPRPEANYSDILLKLKPYWSFLVSPVPNLADEISRLQAIVAQLLAKLAALNGHKSKIPDWAQAIKDFEGWGGPGATVHGIYYPKGTLSYRNNNPGNIKYAGQKGTIGKDTQSHAIFKSYQDGWNALITQLTIAASGKSKVYSPDMTLLQFFTKYAEGNQQEYTASVAKKLQVTISTPIKQLL
jgi:hypothetical protein